MSTGSTPTALFLCSVLLLVCLSAGDIVKRKAPDGQLYIFSSREGCESVQSEAPCTLTWQLNPYLAKVYKQQNKAVATSTQLYRGLGYNQDCTKAIEKALCSQAVPKCSVPDGSRDYGDVSKLCQDVYNKCPESLVDNLKQQKFCQGLKTGKHPNSPCVAPSSPVTGACPQPKYKMPSENLAAYRKSSASLKKSYDNLRDLKYDSGERIFSSECITLLEDISCSPTYCSADETKLLMKHDQGDCNKIIKECIDDPLSKVPQISTVRNSVKALRDILQLSCDTYPKASTSQLQTEPPTVAALSTASCQFAHPILLASTIAFFVFKLLMS